MIPELLKYAEVVPIYKSGKKSDVNNYRPISLLSPFSKIFESLVCESLIFFCQMMSCIKSSMVLGKIVQLNWL